MTVALTITLDTSNLRRFRLLAQASRMAAAKSLTFTAERAVPAWRLGNQVFHRRNTWIDKGVQVRAARPNALTAYVGTLDKYMGRHIKGFDDEKRGASDPITWRDGGRLKAKGGLFVPVDLDHGKTHRGIISQIRAMYRTKRKPFWIIGHGGTPLLVRREGKARSPLQVLAMRKKTVDITPRLDALSIVDGVVQAEYPPVYERLLLKWAETGRS